jgi:iron complex transport system permease protein
MQTEITSDMAQHSPSTLHNTRATWLGLTLILLGVLLTMLGVGVGSTGWESVFTMWQNEIAQKIIWEIRLPRTLGALTAGALLGISGAVAQGLFRNPLADPYLLGSASGASLGVASALVLFGASPFTNELLVRLGLTGAGFIGAILAVSLTLLLARGVQHSLRLLLAGVIVGVVLGAITSLLALFRPDILQAMQSFMLGSTAFVGWSACFLMLAVWLFCLIVSVGMSQVLDGLILGETTASSLGLPLAQMRLGLVAVIALSAATAVAQTGLIVFVGLAAPHLVRAIVKVRHARLILLSSLMGAILLLVADIAGRWIISPQELPVGIFTAFFGGGYLLYRMFKQSRYQSEGTL